MIFAVCGDCVNCIDYLLVRRRYQEITARAVAHAFAHDIFVVFGGENQDFGARQCSMNLSRCFDAVDTGQIDVHDCDVGLGLYCQLDRFDPVVGFAADGKLSSSPQTASNQRRDGLREKSAPFSVDDEAPLSARASWSNVQNFRFYSGNFLSATIIDVSLDNGFPSSTL
jgi:hypothetical protein